MEFGRALEGVRWVIADSIADSDRKEFGDIDVEVDIGVTREVEDIQDTQESAEVAWGEAILGPDL